MVENNALQIISFIGTSVAPIITAITAIAGALFIWSQIHAAQKTAKGEFLLHLDERLETFSDVSDNVKDTKWRPENKSEQRKYHVNRYMGVFERIQTLLDDNIIDLKSFDHLYGDRVRIIVLNDYCHQKLVESAAEWKYFIKLCKKIAERRLINGYVGNKKWDVFFDRVDKLQLGEEDWRSAN